mmetsp:Transcript_20677/g.53913  ORF Transcript_20677/g.53913 Transcript_20677/m.53913 type:complete len:105 (+) Transcript_20677:2564-2878(+)
MTLQTVTLLAQVYNHTCSNQAHQSSAACTLRAPRLAAHTNPTFTIEFRNGSHVKGRCRPQGVNGKHAFFKIAAMPQSMHGMQTPQAVRHEWNCTHVSDRHCVTV